MGRIFNRTNGEGNKPICILVPVKGDSIDDEAMRLAYVHALAYNHALAKKGSGRTVSVDVVYVVQVPHALPLDADLPDQVEKGERALDHAEAVAREMGLEVNASILQARSAGAAIVDMARENNSDLIVMATGYQKKLGELDLGRTIPYVLKNAGCRVWVCRAPQHEEIEA